MSFKDRRGFTPGMTPGTRGRSPGHYRTSRRLRVGCPRESNSTAPRWIPVLLLLARRESDARTRPSRRWRGEVLVGTPSRVAENYGLNRQRLAKARKLVEENENEIRRAWKGHFNR